MLDEQTGVLKSGNLEPHHKRGEQLHTFGKSNGAPPSRSFGGDAGGASRFFYCAKPSRGEKDAGCAEAGIPPRYRKGDEEKKAEPYYNHHPTVKSIALMRWLVRLVTPPGGIVLDPFCGSGTTGCAVVLEGFNFGGCDIDGEYVAVARARIAHWQREAEKSGKKMESSSAGAILSIDPSAGGGP